MLSIIFIFSVVIMCASAVLIADNVVTTPAEKFWVFIASVASHLGLISVSISLFAKLNSSFWFLAQILIFIIVLFLFKYIFGYSIHLIIHKLFSNRIPEFFLNTRSYFLSLRFGSFVGLLCIMVFLAISLLNQIIMPISGFDERMYHASRVLYWVSNHSILPYVTHNDRQIMLPFGAELFFLWPILFTKSELVGRVLFWTAYPLAVLGLYFLLRELEIKRTLLIFCLLTFVATPIIASNSVGLKPEMWSIVFVLGMGFWTVRFCKNSWSITQDLFFSSFFLALCINVKQTSITILPSLFILSALVKNEKNIISVLKPVILGLCISFLVSGYVVILNTNLLNYGHPLGDKTFRKVVSSDFSVAQVYTHAVRLTFLLLEFPVVSSERARTILAQSGNNIISMIGADKDLPHETGKSWPGTYAYTVPTYANKFSLGGIIWLPLLSVAVIRLLREVIRTFPKIHIKPLSALVVLEVPFLGGISFLSRWQAYSGVPERFLLGSYALGLVISTVLMSKILARGRCFKAILWILMIYMIYGTLYLRLGHVQDALSLDQTQFDEPFTFALKRIPSGAHILLAGHQDVRDYPLFAPRNRYSNRVIPWGKLPFDSMRMRNLIETNHITHILIQSDQELNFHWDPSVSTKEMVEWLTQQPNLRTIPLPIEGMRLFEVNREMHSAILKNHLESCWSTLDAGWYDIERDGQYWLRWTSGRGQAHTFVERETFVLLQSDFYTITEVLQNLKTDTLNL